MEQRLSFAETKIEKKTTLRTRTDVLRLPLALLFTFAITLLGVGKGWAQCTPSGQAGSTEYYNNCGASSVTFEHTGATSSSKILWSATEPPVAYSANFGTAGNFQLTSSNSVNYTSISNSAGGSTISATGDVQILMNNLGSFDPNVYKYFVIHYQVTGNAAFAQRFEIFWNAANAPGPTPLRMLRVYHSENGTRPNFGQAVTVVIDASKHPQWTTNGNITGWRLDPISPYNGVEVTFVIDYIALTSVKPEEAGQVLEAYSVNDGQPYINESSPGVIYGAQLVSINGLDTYGYSTTKTISNPSPGESWYSDALRAWSCNSSSIKHEFCGFDPGAITTNSSTICYGSTSALPQITQSAAPDGTAPYTYQWKHTYNGSTNVISGATGATYTPNVSTYNTQAGEHVFTRWVKDQDVTDFVQSTGSYTLTVRPQLSVSPSPSSPTITYGQSVDINVVTSPYAVVSTSGLPAGVSYNIGNGHIQGTPTAAGTSNYTVSVTDAGNCPAVSASGTITVNRATATVTAANKSKTYGDSDPTLTATVSGLVNGDAASVISYTISRASGENIGTYAITPSGNATQGNYNVTYVPATLTINKRNLTITANPQSYTYDGSAHGESNHTYTGSSISSKVTVSGLKSGDNLTSIKLNGQGTNAGTYNITPSAAVVGNSTTTNNYNITYANGTLTINKRQITLTSAGASKQYDGDPLTNSSVSVTSGSFVSGQGATYNVTGSQTLVGSSNNTFTYTLNSGTLASNYTITPSYGTLTVTNRTNKYQITVVANSATHNYDGTSKSVSGFQTLSFTVNGHQYTVSGLSASVSQTNAGTYTNTITGTAVVKDASNNNVTSQFTVNRTNGTLTINKVPITITANNDSKVYDNNSSNPASYTATVTGKPTNGVNPTYTVTRAAGENVGTYALTVTAAASSNPNYTITVQGGTFTITPANITLTCPSGSALTKIYDGTELHPAATATGVVSSDNSSIVIEYSKDNGGGHHASGHAGRESARHTCELQHRHVRVHVGGDSAERDHHGYTARTDSERLRDNRC